MTVIHDPDRITQLERTRRGVCSRCGHSMVKHDQQDGKCSDGEGSYSWAQTREETKALIRNLEAFVAAEKANPMTDQQHRLLTVACDLADGRTDRLVHRDQLFAKVEALGVFEMTEDEYDTYHATVWERIRRLEAAKN